MASHCCTSLWRRCIGRGQETPLLEQVEFKEQKKKLEQLACCPEPFRRPSDVKAIVAFGSSRMEVGKRLREFVEKEDFSFDQVSGQYTAASKLVLLTGTKDEIKKMGADLYALPGIVLESDDTAKNTHDNARWTVRKMIDHGLNLTDKVALVAFPALAAASKMALLYQGLSNVVPVFPASSELINWQDTIHDEWLTAKLKDQELQIWSGALNFGVVDEKDESVNWIYGSEAPGEQLLVQNQLVPRDAIQRWVDFMKLRDISHVICLLNEDELAKMEGGEDGYKKTLQNSGLKPTLVDVMKDVKAWQVIKAVLDERQTDDKILVHCKNGFNRTGVVLGACLKHVKDKVSEGLSYDDASDKVRKAPKGVTRVPKATGIEKLMTDLFINGNY